MKKNWTNVRWLVLVLRISEIAEYEITVDWGALTTGTISFNNELPGDTVVYYYGPNAVDYPNTTTPLQLVPSSPPSGTWGAAGTYSVRVQGVLDTDLSKIWARAALIIT